MLISVAVAISATALLIGLAVRIGTTAAVDNAWNRIAAQRQLLRERRRALDEREVALSHERMELLRRETKILRATEDCPDCGRRRQRDERSAS